MSSTVRAPPLQKSCTCDSTEKIIPTRVGRVHPKGLSTSRALNFKRKRVWELSVIPHLRNKQMQQNRTLHPTSPPWPFVQISCPCNFQHSCLNKLMQLLSMQIWKSIQTWSQTKVGPGKINQNRYDRRHFWVFGDCLFETSSWCMPTRYCRIMSRTLRLLISSKQTFATFWSFHLTSIQ